MRDELCKHRLLDHLEQISRLSSNIDPFRQLWDPAAPFFNTPATQEGVALSPFIPWPLLVPPWPPP
jgi:hypothetical protein